MHATYIVIAAASLAAWIYLFAARGWFWRVVDCALKTPDRDAQALNIAAVIPARDEATHIASAVESLLRQNYAGNLHIFLVDDQSSDGTATIAGDVVQRLGREKNFTVIAGSTPPAGWTGKLWAMQQGIERARQFAPELFLLTDADIEHDPQNLFRLAVILEQGNYDLASFMVRLHCRSLAEKFLIPAFVFFFFKLYPPQYITDSGHGTAGAAGGCMLIRAQALERAGGIEAIRGEIIDDCALARAVKRTGGKVWLGTTSATRSLREYSGLAEIWRMIARTAFNQLRHSVLWLFAALLGMTLIYIAPLAVLFSRDVIAMITAAAACALMFACYLPAVRFYKLNPLWACTLPLAATFYMGGTLKSALDFWRGRGGQWKGRTQDTASRREILASRTKRAAR